MQGAGAGGGEGGTIANSTGDIKYAGGNGGNAVSSGSNRGGGGGGGSAFTNADGNPGMNGTTTAGGDGGTGSGNGGKGGDPAVANSTAGNTPGGGGGGQGGDNGDASKNGANGRIIITVESVLPITLQSFNARPTERTINLEWITASELDNEKFIIERSADGRAFSAIGELPGSGTTDARQTYRFEDVRPLTGQNYYRLQQIDYDGTFDYSPVASAVFAARGKLTLFPTVTRDLVTIVTGEDAPATVRVFDLNGRLLQQQEFGAAAQRELYLGELPAGTYLVSVETAGQTYQERVVKQ